MFHLDESAQDSAAISPIELFKQRLDEIDNLPAMRHVYQRLLRAPNAPPEIKEHAKQRYDQLLSEDIIDPLGPLSRGYAAVRNMLEGRTGGSELVARPSPLAFSKEGALKAANIGAKALGVIGQGLLGYSEGYRGMPLTAVKLQELDIARERASGEETHRQAQLALESRKLHDSDRKELMGHLKTVLPTIRAMSRANDEVGFQQLEDEFTGLYGDRAMVRRVMNIARRSPDNLQAFLMAVGKGKLDDAYGLTSSLGEDVELGLKILESPQRMAVIRNWAHSQKPKEISPLTDDERKMAGLPTSIEQEKLTAETTTAKVTAQQAEQKALGERAETEARIELQAEQAENLRAEREGKLRLDKQLATSIGKVLAGKGSDRDKELYQKYAGHPEMVEMRAKATEMLNQVMQARNDKEALGIAVGMVEKLGLVGTADEKKFYQALFNEVMKSHGYNIEWTEKGLIWKAPAVSGITKGPEGGNAPNVPGLSVPGQELLKEYRKSP